MVGSSSNPLKEIQVVASLVLLASIDLDEQTVDIDSYHDFPPPPTWTLEEVPSKMTSNLLKGIQVVVSSIL